MDPNVQLLAVVGIAVLWFGAAFVFARTARPPGQFAYRWGLFTATLTGLLTVLLTAGSVLHFRRTSAIAISVGLLWAASGVFASIGLVRRSRLGLIIGFVFYGQMVLWLAVFNTLRGVSEKGHESLLLPVAAFVATNIVYFRKRWRFMSWN